MRGAVWIVRDVLYVPIIAVWCVAVLGWVLIVVHEVYRTRHFLRHFLHPNQTSGKRSRKESGDDASGENAVTCGGVVSWIFES